MGISILQTAAAPPASLSDTAPAVVSGTTTTVGVGALASRFDHAHKMFDSGWIAPVYENGWIDYDTLWGPVRYRKIGTVVFLRGLMKNGTVGQQAFTLPVGFRCETGRRLLFVCESIDVYCRVEVWDNGLVVPSSNANNGWVSLVNVIFPADA
jgi:hypothetical protein